MRLTCRGFLKGVTAAAVVGAPAFAQASVKIGSAVLDSYILARPIAAAVEKGFFREAGMPIRMTATQGEGNDFVLVGPPEGTKMADLRGKAIGVTRAGAATGVFARMTAKAAVHKAWAPYFPEDGRISVENLRAMQDALLDAGYTTEFAPVRL